MNFSEDNFKELEEQLKVKPHHLHHLKVSIQQGAQQKRSKKKSWIVAMAAVCLFALTFPLYSPVVADLIAKDKPLEIAGGHPLTDELLTLLLDNGYEDINSVGVLTQENVVEVTFVKGASYDEQALTMLVQAYLLEQGYDAYTVDIQEIHVAAYEGNPVFNEVIAITEQVFTDFGYAGTNEMAYATPGLKEGFFSNTVTLDMPDHIEQADDIVAAIEAEMAARDLDVKDKIEVETFNLAHRMLDGAWGTAGSAIYDAMAGQSVYELTGMSYSVKKGHATLKMKTAWTEKPSAELSSAIEVEIKRYLQSPEVLAFLPEQSYTIQFVNEETVLFELTQK